GGARIGATVAGLALAGYWALPFDAQQRIGLPRLASGIEIFGLAGVLMVAGTTWALSANGDLLLRLGSSALTSLGRSAPALRLASAHLWRQPFRTGVTTTMFALVVFMLTVMQVITAAAVQFHADADVTYGGWDLRGQVSSTAGQRPETGTPEGAPSGAPERLVPPDGPPAGTPAGTPEGPVPARPTVPPVADLRAAEAVVAGIAETEDLQGYVAAAGVRSTALFAITQLNAPAPTWGGYVVAAIDEGFARGNSIPLQTRATGYATDREVWEGAAGDQSLAVIDANSLPSPQLRGGINLSTFSFTLQGIGDQQTTMEPVPVWIGNPSGGGARKVSIIGVIDRRAATAFRGVYVAPDVLRALGAPARPATTRLFFRLQPGVNVNEARAALGAAFFTQGLQTEDLQERFQNESGPLILASRMLQLFVGLGLFVGVAALGVISTRAAVERRQEIGVLRALGLSRGRVTVSLLLESALVVVLGSVIGITLGLVLCRNVFAVQFFDRFQQGLKMVVPWQDLLLTLLLTCVAALVATWLPARQASRIPPIAAIREA
ncbi:MAG: FtsX-like permease family protein, partial [Chloroflexota bacterium]|nr:FtsX-like permease family protein [Chloroflexota bacterium]